MPPAAARSRGNGAAEPGRAPHPQARRCRCQLGGGGAALFVLFVVFFLVAFKSKAKPAGRRGSGGSCVRGARPGDPAVPAAPSLLPACSRPLLYGTEKSIIDSAWPGPRWRLSGHPSRPRYRGRQPRCTRGGRTDTRGESVTRNFLLRNPQPLETRAAPALVEEGNFAFGIREWGGRSLYTELLHYI